MGSRGRGSGVRQIRTPAVQPRPDLARLSTPTRMPEGKYVNKLSGHPIVDVVPHSGQRHTAHTLGTAATSRRTYARLLAQNSQHLSNVVVYRIRRSRPVSGPPLRRLFD